MFIDTRNAKHGHAQPLPFRFAPARPRPLPVSEPAPISVLLVDDGHAPQPLIEQAVGALGQSLRRAASAEAPALAGSGEFALVLVVAGIAEQSAQSVALVGRISAATRACKTPVIVLAPDADCAYPVEDAYAAGALDVLLAPLLPRALTAKIGFFLDAWRTAAERRRSDAALDDTRAQLETTLAAAELATWSWDPEADRVSADAPMRRLYGIADAQADGAPVAAYLAALHPDDLAATEQRIAEVLATGQAYDVEYRVRQADGAYRQVIARGGLVRREGAGPLLRGVVIDITRRRQTEERLRASEERYRTLFDSVDDGVCMIEMLYDQHGKPDDYRFLEMNAAFVKHTGLVDAIGKTVREMVPGHEQHWFDTYGKVALTGEPIRFIDEAKGLKRWYDVYAARVGGAGSRNVAVLFTDISARMATEAELRRLAADLSEADRRKNEFLATLAHELRNPLAPIRSGLQVMRLAGADAATSARVQDIMDRQLNHLVALVDDLLDVARITRGQVELKTETVTLQQVLDNAVETSLPLIEEAQHRLHLDIAQPQLLMQADPTRLRQVVSNLLNNAAKYTPRGGSISLAARTEGGQLHLSVSDNGIGIDAADLGGVFQMFSQVGRARQRNRGGLGIGLSLVRSLVELHGGSVTAASAGAGQGSVFTVRLPLAAAAAPAGPAPQPAQAPASAVSPAAAAAAAPPSLRVLVVDDNRDAASTLAELLDLIGYTASVANGGAEALAAAPGFGPHVMFLDIGMPGMNGYELARAIRQDRQYQGVLLVALTGWGGEDDRARTREAGFDLHLTKPVNLDAVTALLSAHAASLQASPA